MNQKTVAKWVKTLEAERAKVGKARDSLRETLSEMESLKESCEEAYDNINEAIDRLSEMA